MRQRIARGKSPHSVHGDLPGHVLRMVARRQPCVGAPAIGAALSGEITHFYLLMLIKNENN